VRVNYIGGDAFRDADIFKNNNVCFYNLRESQSSNATITEKMFRVLKYYIRLIRYAWQSDTVLFHIQWLNRFLFFDRTILNLYYKIIGKKLVFTAHNVNAGKRDGKDSFMNRLGLKFMYKIVDHIIVHTEKMRRQIVREFGVGESKVSVIPHGIVNVISRSDLTSTEAKRKLSLRENERAVLFFGVIAPYKGLEFLLLALSEMKKKRELCKLIIAGRIEKKSKRYWEFIQGIIKDHGLRECVVEKAETIADKDVEIYFKAADVLALPYKCVFQSGVLFLAFNFGLPVIATDVGSLGESIIDRKTGFLCRAGDPVDLADKISRYFRSELFLNLDRNRLRIMEYAKERYSWDDIARKTRSIYEGLLWKDGPFQGRT
jgi:glycosyltransferase involved in cell wall biosynthesis